MKTFISIFFTLAAASLPLAAADGDIPFMQEGAGEFTEKTLPADSDDFLDELNNAARRDEANTFEAAATFESGATVDGTTVLRAVTDQTDPITEWRDEDNNVVAELGPDGTLLVKAFATSDPSTIVFNQPTVSDDATTLALPTSGNQILWDSDSGSGDVTIEAVSGGAAGAVYFVVNADSTHSLVFDDSDPDVTVRGGADLTVGPGESCTIIQVTNSTISVH